MARYYRKRASRMGTIVIVLVISLLALVTLLAVQGKLPFMEDDHWSASSPAPSEPDDTPEPTIEPPPLRSPHLLPRLRTRQKLILNVGRLLHG